MFRRNHRVALLAASLVGGLALSSVGLASAATERPIHRERLAPRTAPSDRIVKPTEAPRTTEASKVGEPESHNPLSLTLTCGVSARVTKCSWSGDVSGVANYLLLRSTNSATGRVFGPFDPTTHSAIDALTNPGASFSYVVVARDGSGKAIAHSDASKVTIPAAGA